MANANVICSADMARREGLVSVDGRTYPLKSARIEARAQGGVAATTLTQTYSNPYPEPLEVYYTLPLPANGAVTGYTIRLGNRVIRGEVRRREEAREEYRQALLDGRLASLLEQDRADTFTQRLGCLPPGEIAEVKIEILQTLIFVPPDGQKPALWEYRFPTVVGVRYQGAQGRVPDADRLDVERASDEGTPVRLEAGLLIGDGQACSTRPFAPGREVDLADCEAGVRVALRDQGRLDRDLVIRWTAVQPAVGMRVVEGKGLPCDQGRYLIITLTPPAAVRKAIARDLTILIDASGSMAGKPIERAKIVAEELLRSLSADDRFEVLAFSNQVEGLVPRQVDASARNINRCLNKLAGLEAGGGTEMTSAIIKALAPLRPDSQRQVILITDGYVGFEGEVIGEVLRRLAPGARLHTVGIGSAPNRTLTRGTARAGRGIEILVGDNDDARAASRRLLLATVRPILTDLEVSGAALVALAPQRPRDVLEGQPVILLAEVARGGGELIIRGRLAGYSGAWSQELSISSLEEPDRTTASDSSAEKNVEIPLGSLFARERIEDLELELSATQNASEKHAIESKIEAAGLRHGIASRMTSLIAVSEDPAVDPKDPRRRQRLAVELPAEVSAEGVGMGSPLFMAQAVPALMARSKSFIPTAYRKALPFMLEDVDAAHVDYEYSQAREIPADEFEPCEEAEETAPVPIERSFCIEGRVLLLKGRLLIMEFEVPADGFLLPCDGSQAQVSFHDGHSAAAWVAGDHSSPAGPHQQGLTVRLALNLEEGKDWQVREAWIMWPDVVRGEIPVYVRLSNS